MNISVLVIDHGISESKSNVLQLMKSIKMEYLPIAYCNTISEACPKYLEIFHDLIIVNVTNLDTDLFDFLEKYVNEKSSIILMSDTPKHALNCIKYNITDYLITPISNTEFQNTILKAIALIAIARNKKSLRYKTREKFNKFITVTSLKKIDVIKVADILYFEADGRYTLIHSNNGTSKIASKNIGEFQKLLNDEIFCRIHHKYIINLNRLLKINKIDGYSCQMSNDLAIPVSKRKLEQLNKILNI
jgi:two-component system LytT family response regulator